MAKVSVGSFRVELYGVDLPGRSCGPRPGGGHYEDVHVGLKRGTTAIDLCPGDAPEAKSETPDQSGV